MASHKNILKHRMYWDFMNRIADIEKNGEPFDQTTTGAFADFLDEEGDRRGILARLATRHHLSDNPFGGVDAVHPSHPRQVGTAMIRHVPDPETPALPLAAYQDNSHSGVELHAHHAGIPARGSWPVLHWRQHIPRTVSTQRGTPNGPPRPDGLGIKMSRTARLTAPVTPDQLHDFIDAMPNGQTKTRWRAAAHQNGWHRSTGPTKLARNSDRDPLIEAIRQTKNKEFTPSLAFADHLAETGTPGEHVVREAANIGDRWLNGSRSSAGLHRLTWDLDKEYEYALHVTKDRHESYMRGAIDRNVPHSQLVFRVSHFKSGERGWTEPVDHNVLVHSVEHLNRLTADFPKSDRKHILLTAKRAGLPLRDAPTKLARIVVRPGIAGKHVSGEGMFTHTYHDETGKQLGIARVIPRNDGRTIHMEYIGPHDAVPGDPAQSGNTGTGHVRQVFRGLAEHYPNAQFVTGTRAGGATPGKLVAAIPGRGGEPGKLARNSDRDPLIASVWASTHEGDLTPSAVFADHLAETDTPGEQVVREAVAHGDRFRSDLDERDPVDDTPYPHRVIVRGHAGDDESPYKSEYMWEVYHARPGSGFPYALNVRHSKASPGWPIASHTVGVKSLGHLAHLMKDFPKETKLHALTSLREHEKGTRDPMEALAWHRPPETMTQLARNADRDPLIHAIRQSEGDKTPSAVFADHLAETGTPGEHIVRAHANDPDPPQVPSTAALAAGHAPEWSWAVHQRSGGRQYPHHVLSVWHDVSEPDGPDVTHSTRVHSLRGALPLIRDFPKNHIKRILMAMKGAGLPNHEPAERDRLIWPMHFLPYLPLADYLERTGEPGAHILREAAAHRAAGRGEPRTDGSEEYDFTESPEHFKGPRFNAPHWRAGYHVTPDGSHALSMTHHGSGYIRAIGSGSGGYMSNHFSQVTVPVRDQKHLYQLLQDFPEHVMRRFLPLAVRNGLPREAPPERLARNSDRDPLIGAINHSKGDMTPSLAFADHLEETGTPGQHVVRAAKGTGVRDALYGDGHTGSAVWHGRSLANRGRIDTSEVVPMLLTARTDKRQRTLRVVAVHTQEGDEGGSLSSWHGATAHNMEELRHLISDFPAEHQEGMLSAARKHWARHDPTRLARVTPEQRSGLGNAVRTLGTDNHEERARIAKQVMQEAGLRAAVRAAIAVDGPDTRPAHVIAVHGATSPEHVAYAAAWYGLLSGERALRVFHPGEGEDILHVMDAPVPADHAVQYMQRAGIPSFAVERRGSGSRVYAQHNEDLSHLAKGLNARHSTLRGTVARLGAGQSTGPDAGADSRSDFRSTIRAAESAADTGPVSP